MLGLILIYFIGKAFYDLSIEHERSKWGFAILGVISYYAGTLAAGIALGLLDVLNGTNYVETLPRIVLGLIGIPFGLLTCWILFRILKANWNKTPKEINSDVLDNNLA